MKTNNSLNYLGLGLIFLVLTCFLISVYGQSSFVSDQLTNGGAAIFAFAISIIYFITILIWHIRQHRFKKFNQGDEYLYANALTLFSLSAHTLNYTSDIQVFAPYIQGMIWYVVLMHVAILVFPYRKQLPAFVQYGIYFINGAGLMLALYLTIFLGPLIFWAIPLSIFLGISMNATVPLWFLIQFIQAGLRMESIRYAKTAYWLGILTPALLTLGFMSTWHQIQQRVQLGHEQYLAQHQDLLPEWVVLSQYLPDNPMVERVLMSDARAQRWYWDDATVGPFNLFNSREMEYHDPLATISHVIYGDLPFDDETIIHILESRYDARHMTHRRLWRGTDLQTTSIDTDIQVYPAYRLAYVEKVLTIRNTSDSYWRPQEAVYSFLLPEGSVVTSLSLWIEGKEELSRLTTRGKADSAYVQIVGVESRDPALLHWQEGNRVTVTVFPCTTEEDRQFKVGFTIPLSLAEDRLVLSSIPFDGPETFLTRASFDVQFIGSSPQELDAPMAWNRQEGNEVSYKGSYLPNWELSFRAPNISSVPFSFGGHQYQMMPLQLQEESFSPKSMILDINASWNWFEMEAIWEQLKGKEVYAFTPEKTRLTEDNYQQIYRSLAKRNFSLLPIHLIDNPEEVLVISHSPAHSPFLSDLDGTIFADHMRSMLLQQEGKVHWYNLSRSVSPYLKSLKEFRVIHFASGDLETLHTMIEQEIFPYSPENDTLIALQHTGVHIQKTPTSNQASNHAAPDHLLRLFVYQELMQDIGQQFFDRDALEESWIRKAEEAYIVSPVSSLVVLETKKDYERFGIKRNEDTLGNASLGNSGAVPEPHEWVLIVLVSLAALGTWWKKGF